MPDPEMPSQETVLAMAQLLPPDLAREMADWEPIIQEAVLTGVTAFVARMEELGLVADPVAFERLVRPLAYTLRHRSQHWLREWERHHDDHE